MVTNPNVKINLGLYVIRKREDGFHDLETLFVPYYDIHDTLEIITGDDFSTTSASLFARYDDETMVQGISEDGKLMITIARKEGVDWDPLKDLCAKAYGLLAADFDLPPVKIFLEKTSPVGAGLGGGSADAAFALRMMNEIFDLKLTDEALADYASRLGSDCAFFIYNKPMIGTGRGEILSPYDLDLEGYELKVIVPEGVAVSTAEAYKGIKPSGESNLRAILSQPVESWKETLGNDFEATVFPHHPEIPAIKQSLYDSGAVYAAMSGSGSALFAIYRK
ncbi:MAG: 4-(cytidine 5'-diphospho)-2-C-methyl-D-erythritol kinase [Bacteroidales bacterium]|nr:4-(cytidine 5'-diphospho)-2-C-methyl-D-erythritol kinase [Bacteroidales bacterium]